MRAAFNDFEGCFDGYLLTFSSDPERMERLRILEIPETRGIAAWPSLTCEAEHDPSHFGGW